MMIAAISMVLECGLTFDWFKPSTDGLWQIFMVRAVFLAAWWGLVLRARRVRCCE